MSYLEKVKIELATIFSQSGIAELEDNIFPNIGNATRVSYRKGDYKMSIILQSLEDESNGVKSIKESIWYYPANDTPKLLEYIHNTGYLYDYQDDIVSVVANSMMERIDYLYSNGITKIPHYKDVEDVLKQKAENNKEDDVVTKLLKEAIDGEVEINKLTKKQIKLTKRANKSTKLRKAEIDKIRAAGYDVQDVAEYLQDFYIKKYLENTFGYKNKAPLNHYCLHIIKSYQQGLYNH